VFSWLISVSCTKNHEQWKLDYGGIEVSTPIISQPFEKSPMGEVGRHLSLSAQGKRAEKFMA
jgi:hypothetical protein